MAKSKFLVIDDDMFYRTYVADLLSELDIEILSAEDGEAGLNLAVSERPDLIITDIEIPRIQGFTLLRMIRDRQETRDIPVILMSGKVEKDLLDRHSQLREHADGYLLKPFSGQALIDLVEKVLHKDSGEKPIRDDGGVLAAGKDSGAELPEVAGDDQMGKDLSQSIQLRKALIVDDSRYICDITADFLEEIGFTVESALEGEEGLKKALELQPDLILLDIQMPKMNGFVVCEALRKEETTKDAVIVLMSAVVDAETFEKHSKLQYHANAYIQKPFMKSELQDLVAGLIGQPGSGMAEVRGKTGFVVPSEEEIAKGYDTPPGTEADYLASQKELSKARSLLETLKERYAGTVKELKEVRSERDRFEDELYNLRSDRSGREGALQNKIKMLTQRFEESQSLIDSLKGEKDSLSGEVKSLETELEAQKAEFRSKQADTGDSESPQDREEELVRECQALRRDLSAAVSAKKEIEDQVKHILEKREKGEPEENTRKRLEELSELNSQLVARAEAAESRIVSLNDVESQLARANAEIEGLQKSLEEQGTSFSTELEKRAERIGSLKAELDAVNGTKAKEESEKELLRDRIDTAEGEIGILQRQLGEEREKVRLLEERVSKESRGDETLETEKNLRIQAEAEANMLRERIREVSGIEDRCAQLENRNAKIAGALEQSENLRAELEMKLEELRVEGGNSGAGNAEELDERLGKLEAVLSRTVKEAQSVIDQQSARERQLEDNIRSLMNSMQEDKEAFQEEKSYWRKREEELRNAFEEALSENRRIIGEETARLVPMLMPKKKRTLKVVTGSRKYGFIGATIVLLATVLILGYMLFSRTGSESLDRKPGNQVSSPEVSAAGKKSLQSGQTISPDENMYAEIWRRQTVQSFSDDLMIQATLHTKQELEAAITRAAEKEGWSRQRRDNILVDTMNTFNLEEFYYVTVFTKNLHEGYPGYTAGFEKHIALRDNTGRETLATVPSELEGNLFITSRISAAQKEMNPEYMYEVGTTVAFLKDELAENPDELRLVIYDVGAVPMRVMTWQLSAAGS